MPHATPSTQQEFTPSIYPTFPTSEEYPTVSLQAISLQKLLKNDEAEQARVFEACKTRGFFYLELAGCELGETIHSNADDVARVAEEIFKLDVEEKMKHVPKGKDLFGYKRAGATRVDKNSTPDTAEFFNVSKDSALSEKPTQSFPEPVTRNKSLFASYSSAAHTIGLHILTDLIKRLGTNTEEISSRHDISKPAGDHIRLTRGPPRKETAMPEIQTPSHTDFGSITILMNWLGGLQVWSQSSRSLGSLEPDSQGSWLWVKPRPGCAIVNLGDAMVKFTNGVMCSGRHRVVPAPAEQGLWARYSVVYFVRPNDDCRLKVLEGEGIPGEETENGGEGVDAKEWIFRQAERLRKGFAEEK